MATPFPLGTFVGNPDTRATQEQAFEAQFNSFVSNEGATPQFMNEFVPEGDPISSWVSDEQWTSGAWKGSPVAHSLTPVIGLPMVSSGGNADQTYKDTIAGKYDSTWSGIMQTWKGAGFSNLYVRIGYEFNGSWMPWYAGDNGSPQQADWIGAFQHIASIVHANGGKVVWNPNMQNNGPDVTKLYPGDNSVDVIGIDAYNPMSPYDYYDWDKNNGTVDSSFATWAADPVNRMHYWTYQAGSQGNPTGAPAPGFSVQNAIDMAKAHGKSVAMPEGGAGANSSDGVADDGAYPQWLASQFGQSGGPPVAFVNIWDTWQPDHNWAFTGTTTNRPLEAAAWKQYFGAGATPPPPPPPPPPPGADDTLVLTLAEDAYQGDAIARVFIDGARFGSDLTVKASHALSQTQEFDVSLASIAAGTHTVGVRFTNDLYGGTSTTDRNLYVSPIKVGQMSGSTVINTTTYGSGVKELFSTGDTRSFSGVTISH